MSLPFYKWENRFSLPALIIAEGFTYFEITDPSGKVFHYSIEGRTPEQLSNDLHDILSDIESGEFTVSLYPKPKKAIGVKQFRLKGAQTTGSIAGFDIEAKIENALLKQSIKHDNEKSELRREIEQLRKELDEPAEDEGIAAYIWNNHKADVINMIKDVLSNQNNTPAAINGINGIDSSIERIARHIGREKVAELLNQLADQLDQNPLQTVIKLQKVFS